MVRRINLRIIRQRATRKIQSTYPILSTRSLHIPGTDHSDFVLGNSVPANSHTPLSQLLLHVNLAKQYKIKLEILKYPSPLHKKKTQNNISYTCTNRLVIWKMHHSNSPGSQILACRDFVFHYTDFGRDAQLRNKSDIIVGRHKAVA